MVTGRVRRLPGLVIDRVPAPIPRVLPRMDVVGFVGFAAAGPVGLPVVVNDPAGFEEVFGGPLRLAWDGDAGSYTHSHLGPAIRAYFAGGGRRAQVVRVAQLPTPSTPGAERARFTVPGLCQLAQGSMRGAELVARAYGSWADGLSVGAALTSAPLTLARLNSDDTVPVLGLDSRQPIIPGDLLRVQAGRSTGYLPVTSVAVASTGSGEVSQLARVDREQVLWVRPGDTSPPVLVRSGEAWSQVRIGETVERLTLELWVHDGLGENWVLGNVGFAPGHPRYLGDLPTDEQFFDRREPERRPTPVLWDSVGAPRFPLAAAASGVYFPVEVDVVPETFLPAQISRRPSLERDGLAEIGEQLFLDPGLRESRLDTVLSTADHLLWQARRPRRLSGVHALLEVDEVTVIAVPDLVHRPCRLEPAAPLTPPRSAPETPAADDCSHLPFSDCNSTPIGPAPVLVVVPASDGYRRLDWSPTPGEPPVQQRRYRLQTTREQRDWAGSRDLYVGPLTARAVPASNDGPTFYRVRAESGTAHTDWSATVVVGPSPRERYVVDSAGVYQSEPLAAVHRALLRMCAARGDMLALLSLPEHYRSAEAIAHADLLRSDVEIAAQVPAIGAGERRALGFGAVYHPWLGAVATPDTTVQWMPPDGAVAGTVAHRAVTRGAWVAPANESFLQVVALRRHEPDELLPALQSAQVNAIRQTPAGFLCLAEDTLTTDPETRPINVRRLLSLVRRLAALEGTRYVFEPNGPAFRRSIERGFSEVLAFLFRLGAFAGQLPEQAYRVVVADPPNTAQSVDSGRLVVQLMIAPAQPLEFLQVRLIQAGEHGFTLAVP